MAGIGSAGVLMSGEISLRFSGSSPHAYKMATAALAIAHVVK